MTHFKRFSSFSGCERFTAIYSFILKVIALGSLMIATGVKAENSTYLTIATGAVTGVYYPAGNSICKLINKGRLEHHIRCSVESTPGSVSNIDLVRNGQFDVGITQSDWEFLAYQGDDHLTPNTPYTSMRTLFSMHSEPLNIVVRADSNINSIKDLAGKRVNLGNEGSGDRATMQMLMEQFGWKKGSFSLATEYSGDSRAHALCDNRIDAYVSVLGNPNASIKEATTACQAKLLPITGKEVDQLLERSPYYEKESIPGGLYPHNDIDIPTYGVLSVLFVDESLPDEVAYEIVKAVFENFKTFKRLHPAFSTLKKEDMVKKGISAPLHPGAERYYKEVGLL
ncbi:MAG: TAXI family TRAP transporter solute-binding subunit [Vibrio sp.]